MLAHHYLSALELARATGADTSAIADRARGALRDAGNRSLKLNAFVAAARYFEAAVALWPGDDPELPQLQLRLGRALFHGEEGGEAELEAARSGFVEARQYDR